MINITNATQESICLDSFFGVTKILDNVFENVDDDHGKLDYFNNEFQDYVYESFATVDFLYPIMNVRAIEYNQIKNFYLKQINMDINFANNITHNYLKENLNFMLLGDYKNQKIKIYNESNALSLDQINAIGIDPSDCELIYDRSAVPPKPAIFNRDMVGISHGIFFACITVEALSESILFKGFGHPDVSEKKHFSFKQVPPVFNSKYINLYIGQWKLDRHGRNIYELEPKPKVTSNMKDNKELKETFEHILSTGDGEITIKISGVDNDEKSI